MRAAWIAATALTILAAARYVAVAFWDLTAAEAYWWLLAAQWEWASFEGPGGLPFLLGVTGDLLGPSVLVQRLFSPLAMLIATAGIWYWAAAGGGLRAGIWAAVAWNLLPEANRMAMEFGPVLPLVAAWVWFWALAGKAARNPGAAPWWWLGVGLVGATGVLISYWMLLAPFGLLLWLALENPPWHRLWRWVARRPVMAEKKNRPHRIAGLAWLAVLLSMVALTGPALWNASTAWVALAGQTAQSLLEFKPLPGRAGMDANSLAAVLLAVSATIGVWIWIVREFGRSPAARQIAAAALAPCLLAAGALWNGNSPAIPWLLAFPALAVGATWWLAGKDRRPGRLARFWRFAMPAILACMLAVTVRQTAATGQQFAGPDWELVAQRVRIAQQIYQPAGAGRLFLVANSGDIAAALGFFIIRDRMDAEIDFPPVFLRESQNLRNQFGLWPRYDEFLDSPEAAPDPLFTEQTGLNLFLGRSALYITTELPEELPQTITNGFLRVVPIEHIQTGAGAVLTIYFCEDYQTAPL